MPTKQALVAVVDAFEGPWLIAHGYERAWHVRGLGNGEELILEWEERTTAGIQLGVPIIFGKDGSCSTFPPKGARYRFCKIKGGSSPTSVTVEFE